MSTTHVFVTVGTDHHPFNRMSRWVDELATAVAGIVVLMQAGQSELPRRIEAVAYLPYERMQQLLHDADVVVCHGGPATIVEARAAGHTPIVVPRRPELGEHVDEHQVRFTKWMQQRGQVILAEDAGRLVTLLQGVADGTLRLRHDPSTDEPPAGVVRFPHVAKTLLCRGRLP